MLPAPGIRFKGVAITSRPPKEALTRSSGRCNRVKIGALGRIELSDARTLSEPPQRTNHSCTSAVDGMGLSWGVTRDFDPPRVLNADDLSKFNPLEYKVSLIGAHFMTFEPSEDHPVRSFG